MINEVWTHLIRRATVAIVLLLLNHSAIFSEENKLIIRLVECSELAFDDGLVQIQLKLAISSKNGEIEAMVRDPTCYEIESVGMTEVAQLISGMPNGFGMASTPILIGETEKITSVKISDKNWIRLFKLSKGGSTNFAIRYNKNGVFSNVLSVEKTKVAPKGRPEPKGTDHLVESDK